MIGEPGRRHQDQVGLLELTVVDGLGVADDPQHMALPLTGADRVDPAQHDVDVAGAPGEAIGLIRRL